MNEQVRITILVDDEAAPGLAAEHGLSLWIEAHGRRVLFDTGQGAALARNARALGVDLARADSVVLSHGHYDHSGGLAHVLAVAPAAQVYFHPDVLNHRYVVRAGASRPIHMPRSARTALAGRQGDRLHWVTEHAVLADGVGLTGPIPRNGVPEGGTEPFYLDPEGTQRDPLSDDLALWIETPGGLVVCLGCCHAGLENTLAYIARLRPARLRAVLGGLHWQSAGPEQLERGAQSLLARAPDQVVPCHCSGSAAGQVLRRSLGERVAFGRAGSVFEF